MRIWVYRVSFQVLLHVAIIAHVLAYYYLDWTVVGGLDFQAFFHDFIGRGALSAGALLALLAFLFTLVFGRIFCGWACHFGAFQDLAAWVIRKLGGSMPMVRTRFLHWAPYALLLAVFLLPSIGRRQETQSLLDFQLAMAVNPPWSRLPGVLGAVTTFAACGIGILLFLGTRSFCRFVCPYGAVFRMLDPAATFRIRALKACGQTCAVDTPPAPDATPPCTLVCPSGIDVHAETSILGAVRSAQCTRCQRCTDACPTDALAYRPALPGRRRPRSRRPAPRPRLDHAPYTLSAGQEVLVAAVTGVSFLAWDLTLAAHFLAATLALGEGFLVLLVCHLLTRRDVRLGRLALRRQGAWTLGGVLVIGLFLLSLVPLARGGSFKILLAAGDRALQQAIPRDAGGDTGHAPEDTMAGSPMRTEALQESPGRAAAALASPARAELLRRANRAYGMALKIFPGHVPTLRKRVVLLATLRDPAALPMARRLARLDRGDGSAALLGWVRAALHAKTAADGR